MLFWSMNSSYNPANCLPSPDIDNNGVLDENDFQCMAVRACVVEGKGDCSANRLAEYKKLMKNLWVEISEIADDDKVTQKYI